jgi:hypothetical protein
MDSLPGPAPPLLCAEPGSTFSQVAYYIRGNDKTIYFSPHGLTFALSGPVEQRVVEVGRAAACWMQDRLRWPRDQVPARRRWTVKLDFVGANPHVRPKGLEKAGAVISYFRGSPDQWHTGLPTSAAP